MPQRTRLILSEKPRPLFKESGHSGVAPVRRWALALSSLPLLGVVAAFGIAPDTRPETVKLEQIVQGASASVIYVTDASGLAIASSNWQQPDSFVGSNYAFRPYFTRGIADGKAEHFALGSVSKRPGLYISHRVGDASHPQGVVVVKMEFDGLERDWAAAGRPVMCRSICDSVGFSSRRCTTASSIP